MPIIKPKLVPEVKINIGKYKNVLSLKANHAPDSPPIIPPTTLPYKKPIVKFLLITEASPNILYFFLSHLVGGFNYCSNVLENP